MKWLILPFLWIAAIVVAIVVYRRLRRGKHVVLTGRFSPRLVRMVAVVLVVIGVGGDDTRQNRAGAYPLNPIKGDPHDQMPKIQPNMIYTWLQTHSAGSSWNEFKKEYMPIWLGLEKFKLANLETIVKTPSGYSAKLGDMFRKEVEAQADDKAAPTFSPRHVLTAMNEMEKYGVYDHWLNAFFWRRVDTTNQAEAKELIEVYRRIHQHARITDSLISAFAQVRPMMQPPRAWMSKVGPRPADLPIIEAYQKNLKDMVEATAKAYSTSTAGTWERDALVQFTAVNGSPAPNLLRAGKIKGFPEGQKVRVGRLDLLETPKDRSAVLEHEWLGKIELPKDRLISFVQLPDFLPKQSRDDLSKAIQEALDGSDKAADRIERVLPLAHADLRKALKESPKAKGAPRLRMILVLFDDALMPKLREPEAIELTPLDGSGERGPVRR